MRRLTIIERNKSAQKPAGTEKSLLPREKVAWATPMTDVGPYLFPGSPERTYLVPSTPGPFGATLCKQERAWARTPGVWNSSGRGMPPPLQCHAVRHTGSRRLHPLSRNESCASSPSRGSLSPRRFGVWNSAGGACRRPYSASPEGVQKFDRLHPLSRS